MVTRGRGETHRCPIGDCQRAVRAGHLMCPIHWRQVSKAYRDEVWAAWRAWSETHTTEAWERYAAARTDALDGFRRGET